MYVTDRQTDGRTKAMLIAPFPTVGGITTVSQSKHIFMSSTN